MVVQVVIVDKWQVTLSAASSSSSSPFLFVQVALLQPGRENQPPLHHPGALDGGGGGGDDDGKNKLANISISTEVSVDGHGVRFYAHDVDNNGNSTDSNNNNNISTVIVEAAAREGRETVEENKRGKKRPRGYNNNNPKEKENMKREDQETKCIFTTLRLHPQEVPHQQKEDNDNKRKQQLQQQKEWQLPDELLLGVFQWLSGEDLVAKVGLTCRHWRALSCDASLWHSIHRSIFGPSLPSNNIEPETEGEMEENHNNSGQRVMIRTQQQQCIKALKGKHLLVKGLQTEYYQRKLFWACKHGLLAEVKAMLIVLASRGRPFATSINVPRKHYPKEGKHKGYQHTPLTVAARRGHLEIIQELLRYIVDREKYNSHWGSSWDAQEERMRQRSDDDPPKRTWSALMHACCKGHEKIVQLLLHAGAKANIAGYNYTPLMLAAANGHLEIVQILLHANADPNQPLEDSYDHYEGPLNEAVKAGHLAIVQILLKHGADPNKCCHAVFSAVEWGHVEIMKMLLAHGARIDMSSIKWSAGYPCEMIIQGTPLEWARQWKKDTEMVSLLEEHLKQ